MIINNNEETRSLKIGRKLKVAVPGLTTRNFVDTSRGSKIECDFKTAYFYIDWDDENKIPSSQIALDKMQLYKTIRLFEVIIEKFDLN